jgi:L-malate glycosyltransferase
VKDHGKKIVMLIPSFFPNKMGGSEIQALRLSKKLITQGWDVIVFTLGTGGLPTYENVQGINVIRVSGKLLMIPRAIQFLQKRFPLLQRKVTEEVLEEYGRPNDTASFFLARIFYGLCLKEIRKKNISPSVIQVNTVEWVSISGALLAQELKIPLLVKDSTVNGLAKLKLMPFVAKCRQWIIQHSFFVAISSVIKKELLAQAVGEQRIFTINNGIELADCFSERDSVTGNSCLFVGNLYQEPAKGFSVLLDAWSLVVRDIDAAVLNVVGEGDIGRYKQLVKSKALEKSVVFWGKQSDLKNFYITNEIFILSSIREGMSNSLIEAMAYGLPCVSTKVSGSTDLIEHESSGILVEPRNVVALADGIRFLLRNKHLHKVIAQNAKQKVEQLCDINVVAARYGEVYNELTPSTMYKYESSTCN